MQTRPGPTRWWALTALIPLIPFVLIGRFVDGSYLTRLYFAGNPDRWVIAADGGPDGARTALLLDLMFASSFAVVGYLLLRAGHRYWAPLRRRADTDRWIWGAMPAIAVVAGALDLIETTGQLIWLDSTSPPTVATHLIAAIAWWKWVAYAVALVGFLGLVVGPLVAPVVRPTMSWLMSRFDVLTGDDVPASDDQPDTRQASEERLGITASGGGIRSAAVMLGAFRGLSEAGTFQRARWVHAVSGGGYAAGGWRASSLALEETDLFGEGSPPWMSSIRNRRRYLDNGRGSIVGGVIAVVLRSILVLGSVVAAAVAFGWVVGWLTQTWAVVPTFSNSEGGTTFAQLIEARLVLPGMIPLLVAGVVLVASRTTSDRRRRATADGLAAALGSLGVLLLGLLVAIPIGIWSGRLALSFFREGSAETSATILGIVSVTGFLAAVWRVLKSEIKKRWSRLGGVFLLVAMFALAGKVADDRANNENLFSGMWVPLVAVVWLVVVELAPSHHLTLNGIYRKRLAATFLLDRPVGPDGNLTPIRYEDECEWTQYTGAPGPELVLCGTAQSTKPQHGGLPALGFSFSPMAYSLFDDTDGQPAAPYRAGSTWEGYPRRWTVSRSMALAGAAFASAMGRQSFGSTNSLLAALNLRLGMWVPNPNRRTWFDEEHPPPRVHLGYFVKELLNRYDPGDDAFVYVTDGGHRDNLGFVEQLRERPDRMIVLDASGDRPAGFGTLRGAIELADVELDAQVDLDWDRIRWPDDDVPKDCITTGTATFRDGSGHVARIVYVKAQISDTTPSRLRQFAATDSKFPDYSTGDQFLTEQEFDMLVEFGAHMADRIGHFIS